MNSEIVAALIVVGGGIIVAVTGVYLRLGKIEQFMKDTSKRFDACQICPVRKS